MENLNFYIFFLTALIPMVVGFVWYGPLFGKAWMNQMGFTEESLKDTNMVVTLIICYIMSLILSVFLQFVVIHQMGTFQTLMNEPGFQEQTGEAYEYFKEFVVNYGDRFRTFHHGAIHGAMAGVMFSLPILAIIARFEKRSFKYVAINSSYWIVTLALMGGVICQFL